MDFIFHMPTKVIFGQGKVEEVGKHVKSIGNKALIVTGKSSAKKAGYFDIVTKALEKEGVGWIPFSEIESNPLTTTVDRGAEFARQNNIDVVIGLGGGSAMDSAKAIAFGAKNEGSIAKYMGVNTQGEALPIVLITTTAGTGSEANNYAVVTDPETKIKKSISSPHTYAKVSIVDPELMLTVPKKVTAYTGIDVFFHAMESYISKRCQPITEVFALKAMSLVVENLKNVYEHGNELKYREPMAWANTLAGIAINLSGTCGIHGMGHPISAIYDIPHGETLAAVSKAFIKFNIPAAPKKFIKVAEILGAPSKDLSKMEIALKSVEALENLMSSVNLPTNLAAFGIKEGDLEELAKSTYTHMRSNLEASPRQMTLDDVRRLFKESL